MGGGGEPGHVQACFRDDRAGQVQADAGDLRQPLSCGQHRRIRAGTGAANAAGADPLGGGDGIQGGLDLIPDGGDRPVQESDVIQVDPDQHPVVTAHGHALQRLGDGGAAAPDPGVSQAGQGQRVALAAGEGLQDHAGRDCLRQ